MDPSKESLSEAVTVSAAARGGGGGTAKGVNILSRASASRPPSVRSLSSPPGAGARGLMDAKNIYRNCKEACIAWRVGTIHDFF